MRAMPLPAAPAAPRPAAGALSTSRPPASTRRRKLGEEERTEELYFQEMAGRRYLADLAREHALMSQLDDRWEAIARVADRIIETATILHDERGGGVWGVSPLGLRGIKWELSIVDDAGGRGLLAAEYPLVPGGKIVLTTEFLERVQYDEEKVASAVAREVAHCIAGHTVNRPLSSPSPGLETRAFDFLVDLAIVRTAASAATIVVPRVLPFVGVGPAASLGIFLQAAWLGDRYHSRGTPSRWELEEAGRLALHLMAHSGFDPRAAPRGRADCVGEPPLRLWRAALGMGRGGAYDEALAPDLRRAARLFDKGQRRAAGKTRKRARKHVTRTMGAHAEPPSSSRLHMVGMFGRGALYRADCLEEMHPFCGYPY